MRQPRGDKRPCLQQNEAMHWRTVALLCLGPGNTAWTNRGWPLAGEVGSILGTPVDPSTKDTMPRGLVRLKVGEGISLLGGGPECLQVGLCLEMANAKLEGNDAGAISQQC